MQTRTQASILTANLSKLGLYIFGALFVLMGAERASAQSIARTWSEEILAAIRIDTPNPPVHARNLFHLAVGMYDAWAVYDTVAIGYVYHERQTAADIASARRQAISYAAYRILRNRYATSANAPTTTAALNSRMASLGYSTSITTTLGSTPAALGNRIAANILGWGNLDGSNQPGGYSDPNYSNPQPTMVVLQGGVVQGGGVPAGTSPLRWQPLAFDVALTQNGLEADKIQKYVGVTWLNTLPFAHSRTDASKPWIDTGGPALLGSAKDAMCKQEILKVLRSSSRISSAALLNISPASIGNNPLGTDGGTGYTSNPVTGSPYASNLVPTGDFARVLAEFWADGPNSETPPGHWHTLANQVADNPLTIKRIGGTGPVVDGLEWDVKTYFALSAATHDAACAAWSLKRYYEGVRPITLIRYMGGKGQCTNPAGPSYSAEGLPLETGVVEVITSATAAVGGRHYGVGSVGDIAVFSWPGEPTSPSTQTSAVRWMKAKDWVPYQRKTFNTPAFPGYVSGHSTFSRAAAEVLTAITGSAYFPGGLGSFTASANSYLVFERGPSQNITLQWATYYDAADQAGQSRLWGGIHVPEDDFTGRIVGSQSGIQAWNLAKKYWDGSILNEVIIPELEFQTASNQLLIRCPSRRGMYYKVESSPDLLNWTTLAFAARASDTQSTLTTTAPGAATFYRVVWGPQSF